MFVCVCVCVCVPLCRVYVRVCVCVLCLVKAHKYLRYPNMNLIRETAGYGHEVYVASVLSVCVFVWACGRVCAFVRVFLCVYLLC